MSRHVYTQDQLVEQSAIGLLGALGWQTVSAMTEVLGPSLPAPLREGEGRTWLGRATRGGVVLADRLLSGRLRLEAAEPRP